MSSTFFGSCGTAAFCRTTGRRTGLAFPPTASIADSPYFHPHSLWSSRSGASWVFSIWNGCCCLGAELRRFRFRRRSFLADAAVTRTRRLGSNPSGSYLLSLLP
jgi:hypothetical protein